MANKEQPERNARIIELRRETTLNTKAIAAKLCEEGYAGTTKNVVIGVLKRPMPSNAQPDPARNARIIALRRATTLSASQIAAKLCAEGYPGTTKNTVIGVLTRHAPDVVGKRRITKRQFLQLFPDPGHCLYSHDRAVPYTWCGAPAPLGSYWCEEHRKVVFEKPAGKLDLRGIR